MDAASGEGSVWVTARRSEEVARIDPHNNEIVSRISVGRRFRTTGPSGLAVGEGAVWVANTGSVARIDPRTNDVTAKIGGVNTAEFVLVAAGSVWVSSGEAHVHRIDPITNARIAKISTGGELRGLAFAAGRLWVIGVNDGPSRNPLSLLFRFRPRMSQIDVNTNRRMLPDLVLSGNPLFITADGDELWFGDRGNLVQVSPLATVPRQLGP